MLTRLIRMCLALTLAVPAGQALADIYRYVDENGTTHFTNMPDDPRFKLYMKTQKAPSPVTQTLEQRHYPLPRGGHDKYHGHVVAAAKTYSLEPALIHAVITAESAYNPLARSPKGAKGLMQLMPGTAQRYGVKNPLDPKQNILGGAAYLRDLLTMFGDDIQLALAAYNAGEGAVAKHGRRIPPYRETLEYVPKVLSYYKRYKSSM